MGTDEAPEPDCWLHPSVRVGPSAISGTGSFAATPLAAGTVVSRLGGRLVSGTGLREILAATGPVDPYVDTITVGVDRHLVLPRCP